MYTSNLANNTHKESIEKGTVILNAMDDVMKNTQRAEDMNLTLDEFITITNAIVDIADDIGMAILESTEEGTGSITLNSTSLVLHVEKDIASEICNSSIQLSPRSGFEIPAIDSFLNIVPETTLYLTSFRFGSNLFSKTQETGFFHDILSLSLKFQNGSDVEANLKDDLRVWLGKQYTHPEKQVTVVGYYDPDEDMTFYTWQIESLRVQHAVQIKLISNLHLIENLTLCMTTSNVSATQRYCEFSALFEFDERTTHIFIPESEITQEGDHIFSFSLANDLSRTLNFTMDAEQRGCRSMKDSASEWHQDGCKVSPMSNINYTLCLCNHL
ncbi:uncharacterized protein [Ptychodera flava]|uniref:uncharacterized protein n=1 Tax=Ptychodera flava TaxID=63121 RepID=UPI00396A4CCC